MSSRHITPFLVGPMAVEREALKGRGTAHEECRTPEQMDADVARLLRGVPAVSTYTEALRSAGAPLRVATICSGSEAPMLALEMMGLVVQHVFSCEIEPFKQAFIFRNFSPDVLFRDACQLGECTAEDAWGVLQRVPTSGVDVLVAGTSCVDFSALNHNKKRLREGGQSGRTFHGMLQWVESAKPGMVLLENVCGAPWDEMCGALEEIGYNVEKTELDSKRFGLPQTRIRGYALALLGRSSADWPSTVHRLGLAYDPPPLSNYLSSSLSSAVVTAKAALTSKRVGSVQPSAWVRCEHRHKQARASEGLGVGRPLTWWAPGGPPLLRTGGWAEFATGLGPRKTDLLDINYIRQAKLGLDAAHRVCMWNLRQNVNWEAGHTRHEMCPCLTPSMLPWVTSLGRPLIGEECLRLQGLPLRRLSLLEESNAAPMDLAGNGMTVPVVAAALAAGLWCGQIQGTGTAKAPPSSLGWCRSPHVPAEWKWPGLTAGGLCTMVSACTPYCLCGSPGTPATCGVCAQTACALCCTNPRHSYQATQCARVGQAPMPTGAFPLVVRLALGGGARTYYQAACTPGVRCAHAQYETDPPSESLHCTVRANPTHSVAWRVGGLRLDCVLGGPITRGTWSSAPSPAARLLLPGSVVAPPSTPRCPSWLNSLGADCTATRPTTLAFEGVGRFSGVYTIAPDCGAPNNALFVHEGAGMWFVFDPVEGHFAFTTTIGYALPASLGFCDVALRTNLAVASIDTLATGGSATPFAYSHAYQPAIEPLPVLDLVPSPLTHTANGLFPRQGVATCGRLHNVVECHRACRGLPSIVGHLPGAWGDWHPLPPQPHACTRCAPLGPCAPAAMVGAWHARPPAIATECLLGTTRLGIDPVALQHRAMRTHARGVCSFRLVSPTTPATPAPTACPCPRGGATPLSEPRPGHMAQTKYSLRDDQRALLAWARTREQEGGAFLDEFVLASRTRLGVSLQLKSEQAVGVAGGVVVDCVGYGKTVVALALVSASDKWPSLAVVPPHLVRQWQCEAQKLFPGLQTRVLLSKGGTATACRAPLPSLVITSARQLGALPVAGWARVIIDESSYLTGAQEEAITKLPVAPRWLLSATPGASAPGGAARIARLLGVTLGHSVCDRVAPWATCLPFAARGAAVCENFARLVLPPCQAAVATGRVATERFLAVALRRSRATSMCYPHTPHVLLAQLSQGEKVSNQLALLANPQMSQADWSTALVCQAHAPDRLGALAASLAGRMQEIEGIVCTLVARLCRARAGPELGAWLQAAGQHRDSPDNLAAGQLMHALSKTLPAVDVQTSEPVGAVAAFFSLIEEQKKHAKVARALRYATHALDNNPFCCDVCGLGDTPATFAMPCMHLLCIRCHGAQACPVPQCGAAFAGDYVTPPPFCPADGLSLHGGDGAKIRVLCNFLDWLPPQEGCLVFFQGAGAGDYLERELATKGHSPWRIRGSPARQFHQTAALQDAQAKGERVVLLLEMGSQEAAGSNLTAFARSVFVHTPYDCPGGTAIDVEKQAIGRTARFGQVAQVHVHHITSGSDSPLRASYATKSKNVCQHVTSGLRLSN